MKIDAVAVVFVALLGPCVSTAAQAAPVRLPPVQAMFERTKMVSFSVRNDTGAPLELKVGESAMTIAAGKTVPMKLAVGTRIYASADTARYKSGELLVEVTGQLSEATVGIR